MKHLPVILWLFRLITREKKYLKIGKEYKFREYTGFYLGQIEDSDVQFAITCKHPFNSVEGFSSEIIGFKLTPKEFFKQYNPILITKTR